MKKRITLISGLLLILAAHVFAFNMDEDLTRIRDFWVGKRIDLELELEKLEKKAANAAPGSSEWNRAAEIVAEIREINKKISKYEEYQYFDYKTTIITGTMDGFKPAADFAEGIFASATEIAWNLVTQSWTDLGKIAVDSFLKARIRSKVRGSLDCSQVPAALEDDLVVIAFGENPWENSAAEVILDKLSDMPSQEIYTKMAAAGAKSSLENALKTDKNFLAKFTSQKNPVTWFEEQIKKRSSTVMDVLGNASFLFDLGSRLWLSYAMEDSLNDVLSQIKLIGEKFKAAGQKLSCPELYKAWRNGWVPDGPTTTVADNTGNIAPVADDKQLYIELRLKYLADIKRESSLFNKGWNSGNHTEAFISAFDKKVQVISEEFRKRNWDIPDLDDLVEIDPQLKPIIDETQKILSEIAELDAAAANNGGGASGWKNADGSFTNNSF